MPGSVGGPGLLAGRRELWEVVAGGRHLRLGALGHAEVAIPRLFSVRSVAGGAAAARVASARPPHTVAAVGYG